MEKPHIEKEYKMMIDESTYDTFLSSLNIKPFLQTNHYYETGSKNMAMRIREINSKYIFTLKVNGDGFKYEYEFEIPDNDLNNKQVKEVLDKFAINDYKYIGKMDTYRATYKMQGGELCVDKSIYNGVTDYEIEYELYDYQNDSFSEFSELLKKYDLEFKAAEKTKLKRFHETIC